MGRRKKSEGAPLSLFSFQDIMACLTGILILIALLLAIDGLSDEMQATPGKAGNPEQAAAAAKAQEDAADRIPELQRRIEELRKELEQRRAGRPVTEEEARIVETRAAQLEAGRRQVERRLTESREELERMLRDLASVDQRTKESRDRVAAAERDARSERLRQRIRFRPGDEFAKAPVFVEPMADGIVIGELDGSKTPAIVADLRDPGADERARRVLRKFDPASDYVVFVVHEDAIPRFVAMRRQFAGWTIGWQLWDGAGSMLDGAPPGPRAERDAVPAAAAAGGAP